MWYRIYLRYSMILNSLRDNCVNIAEQLGTIAEDAQITIMLYPLLFRKDMNKIIMTSYHSTGLIEDIRSRDKIFTALWNISRRAEVKILVKEDGTSAPKIELVPWKDIIAS